MDGPITQWLAFAASGLNLATGALYWPKVKAVQVPVRPRAHQAAMTTVLSMVGSLL